MQSTEISPGVETSSTPEQIKAKLAETLSVLQDVFPVVKNADLIREKIGQHRVILADMEPGSGKSFGLPPIMLDLLMNTDPNAKIIVSESRKNLVKQLGSNGIFQDDGTQKESDMTLKDRLGNDVVDYSNRDRKAASFARIDFAVEQTLINRLINNPSLEGYGAVIIDEAHRNMGILKPLIKKAMELNPNLKVIFATGTANAARERLRNMFPDMGEVKIKGRNYDVHEDWNSSSVSKRAPIEAAKLTEKIIREGKEKGNILTFLPGGKELDAYIEYISNSSQVPQEGIEIIRVMGKDKDTIERIKAESGKRKIIVATNALEEGMDPNCDIVIVSGWRKTKIINPVTGIEEWKTVRISKDSAEQQAKRAGRKRKGIAHFLFSKAELNNSDVFPVEDREDQDLTSDILTLIAAGEDKIRSYEFEDEKIPDHIDAGIQRLQKLGALDKDEKLTEIGRYMADRETEPRNARMLYEAEKRGCDDAVAILIGMMNSDRSVFKRGFDTKKLAQPESDFIAMLAVWNEFVKIKSDNNISGIQRKEKIEEMERNGINISVLEEAASVRKELVKIRGILYPEIKLSGDGDKSREIKRSFLAGLADRLLIKGDDGSYHLENGKKSGIRISHNSGLTQDSSSSIVSGKISHDSRDGRDYAELNQVVDEDIYSVFPYLQEFNSGESAIKKPENRDESSTPESSSDRQEESNFQDQADDIVAEVKTGDSQTASKDASTFIQKIQDNWNNLSEKMKTLFRNFKEKIKKLIGIE